MFPRTTGQPTIAQIALPLVASGHMGEPREAMLGALFDAVVHWLAIGLPLERIKFVIANATDVAARARSPRPHGPCDSGSRTQCTRKILTE